MSLDGTPPSQTRAPTPARSNPFTDLFVESENVVNDGILDSTLVFLEKGILTEPGFRTAATELMDYVEACQDDNTSTTPTTMTSCSTLTPPQVSLVLLPWAIRNILGTEVSTDELVWRALSVCLQLVAATSHQNDLQRDDQWESILTKSTLFKLVPRIAVFCVRNECVLETDDTSEIEKARAFGCQAYETILASNLYAPTLDVACHKVWIPLVECLTRNDQGSSSAKRTTCALQATVRFLRKLQCSGKGNPKTIFGLVATREVLVAASRTYTLLDTNPDGRTTLRDFLYQSLFDASQHMDGFRSLLSKGTIPVQEDNSMDTGSPLSERDKPTLFFRCYQDSLLKTITESIVMEDVDVIQTVPVLLRGFLHESMAWEVRERENKRQKGSLNSEISNTVLFQMFVFLTVPLRKLLVSSKVPETISPATQALRECLESLFEQDAYLPSQDVDGKQLLYLGIITNELSSLSATQMVQPADNALAANCIHSFRTLMQLNHNLLHEQISSITVLLFQFGGDYRLGNEITQFLVVVVETYTKLRRQGYLIRAILQVVGVLNHTKGGENAVSLPSLLQHTSLMTAFANSAQYSPVFQVKEIFETIQKFILGLKESDSSLENTVRALDSVVELTIVMVQNVRVDSGTASEVASLCQEVVDTALLRLISPSLGSLTGAGLRLCGWFIELHARCAFWLGPETQLEIPPSVMEILSTASQYAKGGEDLAGYEQILDELLFLALHRLRQLHSLIHEQERINLGALRSIEGNNVFTIEASKLAFFAGFVAKQNEDSPLSGSRWSKVARAFASWSPYAEDEDVRLFLEWMIGVLATDEVTTECHLDSSKIPQSNAAVRENLQTARALLYDSSFLEDARVASKFALAALSCTSISVTSAIETLGSIRFHETKSSGTSPLPLGINSKDKSGQLDAHLVTEMPLFDSTTALSKSSRKTVLACLQKAGRPLMFVNSLASLYCHLEDPMDFVDSLLRLDQVCRSMAMLSSDISQKALHLVKVLRFAVASTLTRIDAGSLFHVLGNSQEITEVLKTIVLSVKHLCLDTSLSPSEVMAEILTASSALTEQLVRVSGVFEEQTKQRFKQLIRTAFCIDSSIKSERVHEIGVVACLGRSILKGMKANQLFHEETSDSTTFRNIRGLLFPLVAELCLECEDSTCSRHGYLLFGDLIRFTTDSENCPFAETRRAIESVCIASLCNASLSKDALHCRRYVVACLVETRPSPAVARQILDQILNCQVSFPLLDTSFCQLVGSLHEQALEEIFERLVSDQQLLVRSRPLNLRLSRYVVQCVKETDQIEVASKYGQTLFRVAVDSIYGFTPGASWQHDFEESVNLVVELILRRDVFACRELDLAHLLCRLTDVLRPNGKVKYVTDHIFASCGRIIMTIFLRYSKQVYSCVPSMIQVLRSLQRHVLYRTGENGLDIADRAQRLTRLYEQVYAHRDVFKKHVLGLLLDFVYCLQQDTNPTVKESMTPAVYCLLDTLSKYETKQLKGLMDLKAKAVFKAVYQGYHVHHAYKGQ
jgi:hypothetical protein